MSRLAEIYKSEKKKGGGLMSALGKRALEKIDPRQMFNQKGLAAAIAPSLFKTYSATAGKSSPASLSTPTPQISTQNMESKIDILSSEMRIVGNNTRVAAKNSMSLPDMARDMNVMRQNVIKLVKLQGGEATNKADMYFKKSSENEAAYETQFGKQKGVAPTPVTSKEPEKNTGILGFLSTLFAPLLTLGGTIVSAITATLGALFSPDNLVKVFGLGLDVIKGISTVFRTLLPLLTSPVFLGLVGGLLAAKWLMDLIDKKNSEANTTQKMNERVGDDRGSQSSKVAARTIRIDEGLKSLLKDDRTDEEVSDYTRGEIRTKDELRAKIAEAEALGKRAIEIKDSRVVEEARQERNKIADRMDAEIGAPEPPPLPRYNPEADSQSANTNAPSKIPSIPGASKETLKTPTIEKFDYTKYKELVGIREGGGKYDADNKVGFLGKYQFGSQALETFGYLKPGTSADRNAVYSPSNWTGKNGIDSADAFKKASDIQENLMNAYTDMNLKGLQKRGVLTGEDSGSSIAAKLYAAHHGGVGGASKFFKENKDTTDFAFAGASVGKSAALMATAYNTGKIGGAEYSGLGGASVASSATPTGSAGMVGSTGPSTGSTLTTASMEVASAGQAGTTIINNNTTNNNSKTGGGGQGTQGTPNIPSAFDDVFTTLFGRVT